MHCVNNPIRLFAFRVQVTDSIFQDRHCERKRSNPCCREVRMDCFVALLLAMTSNPDTHTHSRGAMRPRFCINRSHLDRQRAQGMPGAQCTPTLACEIKKSTPA